MTVSKLVTTFVFSAGDITTPLDCNCATASSEISTAPFTISLRACAVRREREQVIRVRSCPVFFSVGRSDREKKKKEKECVCVCLSYLDHGFCLLSNKHGLCDFRSIGKVCHVESDDRYTGVSETVLKQTHKEEEERMSAFCRINISW